MKRNYKMIQVSQRLYDRLIELGGLLQSVSEPRHKFSLPETIEYYLPKKESTQ